MSPPQRPSYRIEMASPCGVSWAAMSGDERKRRWREAEALLRQAHAASPQDKELAQHLARVERKRK